MVIPNQNKQTNEQPGVPSESLTLTCSEKAVCCNSVLLWFESVCILCYLEKKLKGFRLKQFVTFSEKIGDREVDVAHPGVRLFTFEPFHWKHLLSGYI